MRTLVQSAGRVALLLGFGLASLPAQAGTLSEVQYFHLDGLGSVRAMSNASGSLIAGETRNYLPYGEEWCGGAPCAPPTGAGQPKRFTGKDRDLETGLDYFGARYYGPKLARFTTVDPALDIERNLVDPQSWNRYAYGRDNPLRYVDPDGRSWVTKVVKVIIKGGDVVSTVASVVGDVKTVFSMDARVGTGQRLLATASVVSELLPVSGGDIKDGAGLVKKFFKKGTNRAGEVTDRAKFRKGTLQEAWDNGEPGPTGGRICPTCRNEVQVEPFSGQPRDWDGSHNPSWTNRTFPEDVTRPQVRDNYQEGVSLECIPCNRGGGNRDDRFPGGPGPDDDP